MIGDSKKKYIFLVRGILNEGSAKGFAYDFIEAAGMHPARPGRIDQYPYNGHGGIGWTGYFPLIESYLIIDVYIPQGYTEILLSTCKPEAVRLNYLEEILNDRIGKVEKLIEHDIVV